MSMFLLCTCVCVYALSNSAGHSSARVLVAYILLSNNGNHAVILQRRDLSSRMNMCGQHRIDRFSHLVFNKCRSLMNAAESFAYMFAEVDVDGEQCSLCVERNEVDLTDLASEMESNMRTIFSQLGENSFFRSRGSTINPIKVSYLMLIDWKSLLHGHLFMLTIGYAFSADGHKYSVDVRSSDMILPVVVSVAVVS